MIYFQWFFQYCAKRCRNMIWLIIRYVLIVQFSVYMLALELSSAHHWKNYSRELKTIVQDRAGRERLLQLSLAIYTSNNSRLKVESYYFYFSCCLSSTLNRYMCRRVVVAITDIKQNQRCLMMLTITARHRYSFILSTSLYSFIYN